MENFWARQSLAATDSENALGAMRPGDPFELPQADDPLGDEAAFPSTWQSLGEESAFD